MTHTTAAKETKTYTIVLGVLLLLTVITVTAAGINFGSGSVNVVIALTIATIKASLVALFFMHLLHDSKMNAAILVAGFIFLGLFLAFSSIDVSSRVVIEPTILKPVPAAPQTPPAQHATATDHKM